MTLFQVTVLLFCYKFTEAGPFSPGPVLFPIYGIPESNYSVDQNIGLRDIYESPVLILVKRDGPNNEMIGYFAPRGVAHLKENTNTKYLHNYIRTGLKKKGLLMKSQSVAESVLSSTLIQQIILPDGIQVSDIAFVLNRRERLPWLFVFNENDFDSLRLSSVYEIGVFNVMEDGVGIIKDNFQFSSQISHGGANPVFLIIPSSSVSLSNLPYQNFQISPIYSDLLLNKTQFLVPQGYK